VLCILRLLSITIASTKNTQYMLITLKILDIKNVVVYTEWRATDSWLGIIRLISSLILLERLLQLVYLILTLLSVWTTKRYILLITTCVYSDAIILTDNGMLTKLLRYTLNELTTVLKLAPVEVANEFV